MHIGRTSPSPREIVFPRSSEQNRHISRRSTWSAFTRRPGQPWRFNVPAGPAMPATWVQHVTSPLGADKAAPKDFRFGDLQLSDPVRQSVFEAGYTEPTPIQAATVPTLLAGKDCVGQAHTGTGKTAAFGLPIVERIDPKQRVVQAIVL